MTQTDVVLVSHGQPSSPAQAEVDLARFVAEIQTHIPHMRLSSATLAAPNSLENSLKHLRPKGVIYPLFMSEGWFVRVKLTERLGTADVRVMSPFGMDPDLVALAARAIRDEGHKDRDPLILVAHGSGSGRAAPEQATLDFAEKLQAALNGSKVGVGFVEQGPKIREIALDLKEAKLCLPFFAMQGGHVRHDVHDALNSAGYVGRVMPVISQLPGVDAMIARAIEKLHNQQ